MFSRSLPRIRQLHTQAAGKLAITAPAGQVTLWRLSNDRATPETIEDYTTRSQQTFTDLLSSSHFNVLLDPSYTKLNLFYHGHIASFFTGPDGKIIPKSVTSIRADYKTRCNEALFYTVQTETGSETSVFPIWRSDRVTIEEYLTHLLARAEPGIDPGFDRPFYLLSYPNSYLPTSVTQYVVNAALIQDLPLPKYRLKTGVVMNAEGKMLTKIGGGQGGSHRPENALLLSVTTIDDPRIQKLVFQKDDALVSMGPLAELMIKNTLVKPATPTDKPDIFDCLNPTMREAYALGCDVPDNARIAYHRGSALLQLGREFIVTGLHSFRLATRFNPKMAEAWAGMAVIFMMLGKQDKANECWTKAVTCDTTVTNSTAVILHKHMNHAVSPDSRLSSVITTQCKTLSDTTPFIAKLLGITGFDDTEKAVTPKL